MCIKLLPYHILFLFYTLFFHFNVVFLIFLFSSDEDKTPEYALSQVKARKTLRTFFSIYFILYLLSVRKEKGE